LDDDLAEVLDREAETRRVSFKEIVNSTLRRGLAPTPSAKPIDRPTVVTRPQDFGTKAGVDYDRMNQLSDELEIDHFLNQQERASKGS